jgi:protein subunit release factor B
MKQDTIVRITSEDNKITLLCEADVAIGALHDFLLMVKGNIVERINKAQEEEQKATDAVKAKDVEKGKEIKEE